MDYELYTFRYDLPDSFTTEAVVLIDTHNFTSTAIQALKNGADGVLPVTEGAPDEVAFVADDWEGGFANHPDDMTHERINSEYIGIASNNGAPAVHAVNAYGTFDSLYLASLTNGKALANHLLQYYEDVTFVLAGSGGHPSPEDGLTASYITHQIDAGIDDQLTEFYKKMNHILVERVYDLLHDDDDWDVRKELGTPEKHAFEHVRDIDSTDVIPVLDGKYFKSLNS